MEEAIKAWESEGGALGRLPWQSLSASPNRVGKLMPAKINRGTIPIQQAAFSPGSLQLEREPYASGLGLALDSQGWGLKRRTRKTRRSVFCLVVRPRFVWLFLIVAMVAGASAQTRSTI